MCLDYLLVLSLICCAGIDFSFWPLLCDTLILFWEAKPLTDNDSRCTGSFGVEAVNALLGQIELGVSSGAAPCTFASSPVS